MVNTPTLDGATDTRRPQSGASSRSAVRGRRRFVTITMATAALLVGVATLPDARPVEAADFPSVMTSDGAWRDCNKTDKVGCDQRGTIKAGTRLRMTCWLNGSWANGEYSSNRWFFVRTESGTRGWVHSSRVGGQTAVDECTEWIGLMAARWAALQIGEKAPSSKEASTLGIDDGMWSGWCQAFASGAYRMRGLEVLTGYGTAADTYREYQRRGLVRTNLDPQAISIGSIVYYAPELADGAGHAAIYVGNGRVATTQGTDDPELPVARVKMSSLYGGPVGWVKPAQVDGR